MSPRIYRHEKVIQKQVPSNMSDILNLFSVEPDNTDNTKADATKNFDLKLDPLEDDVVHKENSEDELVKVKDQNAILKYRIEHLTRVLATYERKHTELQRYVLKRKENKLFALTEIHDSLKCGAKEKFIDWLFSREDEFFQREDGLWQRLTEKEIKLSTSQKKRLLQARAQNNIDEKINEAFSTYKLLLIQKLRDSTAKLQFVESVLNIEQQLKLESFAEKFGEICTQI